MSGNHRVLLFGGTFDPIHHGHLIVAQAAAAELGIDRVVLVAAGQPPHRPEDRLAPAEDRLRMAQLAVAGDGLFAVSDCELERPGPSYTLDTVRYFRGVYGPGVELYWLIGGDNLAELAGWHQVRQLVEECTVVAAARPGHGEGDLAGLAGVLEAPALERLRRHLLRTPQVDISAREIRRRAAGGQSIRYLVPEAVREHIERRGLYRC